MLCVLVYIKQNGETQIKIGQNRRMKKSGGLTRLEHGREGGVGAASVAARRDVSLGERGAEIPQLSKEATGGPRGAAGAS